MTADRYQHRTVEEQLGRALSSDDGRVPVSAVVLHGLGGVGKSQLAAQHAFQAWRDQSVDLIAWIGAASRSTVILGYAQIAAAVLRDHAPAVAEQPPEQSAQALLAWLGATDRRWLIVLDDLQDPADLRGLWPTASPYGQTVVTTRRRDAALNHDNRVLIEVGVFTAEESYAYLAAKLPTHAVAADGAEQLRRLATELGYLPLALAHAAAYIADKPLLAVGAYRIRLADRRRSLAQVMPTLSELPDDYLATVSATWSLSVERANRLAPKGMAKPLLELASLLGATGISVAFFASSTVSVCLSVEAGWLETEAAIRVGMIEDALACLNRLSLITFDAPPQSARTMQVHALVQRVIREQLSTERIRILAQLAAYALEEIWPEVETDVDFARMLRSSIDALRRNSGAHLWTSECHPVLFRAGRSLAEAGLWSEALSYYTQLSEMAEELLGADHRDTLVARGNHIYCHAEVCDYEIAINESESLLSDLTRVLGSDHPEALILRGNIGRWRGESGDVDGAINEYERLLSDRIQILGPNHHDVLRTRHNVDFWRRLKGGSSALEADFELELAETIAAIGVDHPDALRARDSIANWRGESGDVEFAVAEFESLVKDYARILGPDHIDAHRARQILTFWRAESGDIEGASSELQRLLVDRLRLLGEVDPRTLETRDQLASLLLEAGDVAGAIVQLEFLLDCLTRMPAAGPKYPLTLETRQKLVAARKRITDESRD